MCATGQGFRGLGVSSQMTDELAWISVTTSQLSCLPGTFLHKLPV